MKDTNLGAFEELVLLAIGALGDTAYGITHKEEREKSTGRSPSIGAVHSALVRLEEKDFITSYEGGATAERGGRRKRYYYITDSGKAVLSAAKDLRDQLFVRIPGMVTTTGKA